MVSELKLAELICTRLCHDLAGPIGAVSNGSELLEEDGDMAKQAFQLIQSSAKNAVSKLMFFRNAYGRINYSGEADIAEIKQLAAGYLEDSKCKLDWPDSFTTASGVSVSRKMSRVILLLILVASEALVKGGDIIIRLSNVVDGTKVEVSAKGPVVKFEKEDNDILLGKAEVDNLIPKKVPLLLIHHNLKSFGAEIGVKQTDSAVEFLIEKI